MMEKITLDEFNQIVWVKEGNFYRNNGVHPKFIILDRVTFYDIQSQMMGRVPFQIDYNNETTKIKGMIVCLSITKNDQIIEVA